MRKMWVLTNPVAQGLRCRTFKIQTKLGSRIPAWKVLSKLSTLGPGFRNAVSSCCQQNPSTGLGGWKHQDLGLNNAFPTWAAGQAEVGGEGGSIQWLQQVMQTAWVAGDLPQDPLVGQAGTLIPSTKGTFLGFRHTHGGTCVLSLH